MPLLPGGVSSQVLVLGIHVVTQLSMTNVVSGDFITKYIWGGCLFVCLFVFFLRVLYALKSQETYSGYVSCLIHVIFSTSVSLLSTVTE